MQAIYSTCFQRKYINKEQETSVAFRLNNKNLYISFYLIFYFNNNLTVT